MYDIKEIAKVIDGTVVGESNVKIKKVSPFFDAKEDEITFAFEEKYLKSINETNAKVIIVPDMPLPEIGKTYIKVGGNPREKLITMLGYLKPKTKEMELPIEKSAKIGGNVRLSPGVYIGHDVEIGEGTVIYPNVSIMEGVKIGRNCIIYQNVSVREFCEIGDNVILQPGAVVGSDGFGYININGKNIKLEQIGIVKIEDDVELGANTAVDRGAIGDTVIKKGTKIDNLVHIAHNDIIGENCIIIAQVGISGSVEVGNNTIIAGQAGVTGHLKIGNNCVIAARSVVTNDVEDNSKMSGFPLKDHMEDLKIKVAMTKLPETIKRVKEIEKLISGGGK
jgi:UDP-3-O-[3-hydroxymyristoyl] glucosamine N-acyltransferase